MKLFSCLQFYRETLESVDEPPTMQDGNGNSPTEKMETENGGLDSALSENNDDFLLPPVKDVEMKEDGQNDGGENNFL